MDLAWFTSHCRRPLTSLIVFDLDGTLIDSQADLASATNDVLERFGASRLPGDVVAGFVGEGARVLVARALAAGGVDANRLDDALSVFLQCYDRRLTETTRPYAGIVAALDAAASRGVKLAVLTNKPQAHSDKVLAALGLADRFAWVIGGDTGFGRKPDPAGLIWLISTAWASREDTLLVGDSTIDATTARAARVRFCLAAYGFGQQQSATALRPDEERADHPSALVDVFDRIWPA